MNPSAEPSPPNPKIPLPAKPPGPAAAVGASLQSAPPVLTDSPPAAAGKASFFRQLVAVFLSLCLGLFLAAGIVSLLDDSLILIFSRHFLTLASGILGCISFCLLLLIYGLMGLTPIIPKRVFLPILFFTGLGLLVVFPTLIYCHRRLVQLDWLLSLLQVVVVLVIYHRLRGGGRFRWSVVEVQHLGRRPFSWWNLSGFLLLNLLVLLPALAAYLALCASLAMGHFTDGFLTLRPGGLILQARKYVRADGKTILLFPMSHIAETDFYRAVSHSAASNSVVLLEGVTDRKNLLTNGLSYKRAAKSLGLAEQHDDLDIRRGELVLADVDVQEFSTNTIAVLNLVALVHARGLNASTLSVLLGYSPPPEVEQQLFADLLLKRNAHLLKELNARLPAADDFVIPWGAAHMPGIAEAIEKSGFHLAETRDYVSIRFGPNRHKDAGTEKVSNLGNAK